MDNPGEVQVAGCQSFGLQPASRGSNIDSPVRGNAMTLAAKVHVPVRDLVILPGVGRGFWESVAGYLRDRDVFRIELPVKLGKGEEEFPFTFMVTDVTFTDMVTTFIGTYEGHAVAGYVFYRNQHYGQLHIASKLRRQQR